MFDILIVASLIYEYYRREKRHALVIESLKKGVLPDAGIQKENTLGAVWTFVFTIFYTGFLIFVTFFLFVSGKIYLPLWIKLGFLILIPWYGIGVMLVLVCKRNFHHQQIKSEERSKT